MKRTILMVLLLIGVFAQGCSIYKAATAPPPVEVERVRVGADRTDVISVFGTPKLTEVTDGQRTDMFEFKSGYNQASKSRILLYIAGDVFTAGLSELVFWPLELAWLDGTEGRAVATYGSDNKVQTVKITKKDGKPWEH
jgi:hypothetical protein